MAISIGFVVVIAVVGPVRVLVLMGMPMGMTMVAMASQELSCNCLNQEDEKES